MHDSPHYHTLKRGSERWLNEVAQLVEPEIRGYLEMDAGKFVSRIYPNGDAIRLQLCVESINWAFIMDDWMENGVINPRKAHEVCIPALRDPINFDTDMAATRMCKSCDFFFTSHTLILKVVIRSGFPTALRRLLAQAVESGISREKNCISLLWASSWKTVPKELRMIWSLTLSRGEV
jgi:hypothetical protein